MTFFNKLKGKAGCFAQKAAKKSGKMMEITKLNMNISTEKEALKSLYHELGEYCFKKYTSGETNDSTVAELCEEVKIHLENIDFFNEKINEVKNMTVCSSCGNEMLKTNEFCGKCGVKVNAKGEQVEEKSEKAEPVKSEDSDDGQNAE